MTQPHLDWDNGTAYDLFVSLRVLYEPDKWGLRGAWAAGVRSRLSAENREFFGSLGALRHTPLHWLITLPQPKNAQTAIAALTNTATTQRIYNFTSPLYTNSLQNPEAAAALTRIAQQKQWSDAELKLLHKQERKYGVRRKEIEQMLNWWVRPDEFGDRMLAALQNYYNVFFAEEETRLAPYLEQAQTNARHLAKTLPIQALIEELSHGVRYADMELNQQKRLTLAPSFWITPFMVIGQASPNEQSFLYAARPDDTSLVPGDVVPDALATALKALSDPTRLKILRYLSAEPHTPTELAQKLRLRPPTVIHHLHTLRLAQLVHITLYEEGKRYATRRGAIDTTLTTLKTFLGGN